MINKSASVLWSVSIGLCLALMVGVGLPRLDADIIMNQGTIKSTFSNITFDPDNDGSNEIVMQAPGNLGIGTTSPEYLLHAVGNAYIDEDLVLGGNLIGGDNLTFTSNQFLLSNGNSSLPALAFANDPDTGFFLNGAGNVSFASGGSSKLYIDSSGNIGINTETPAFNLDINGNVNIGDALTYSGSGRPKRSIILTATGAKVPSSAGAEQTQTDGTNHAYYTLNYDKDTDESAYWHWVMPDSFDNSVNIDVEVYWFSTATSGNVVWNVQTLGVDDDEPVDAALGAAQVSNDAAKGTASDLNKATFTAFSSGWATGDYVIFNVTRDANNSDDDANADAKLLRVKIEYTVSSESD